MSESLQRKPRLVLASASPRRAALLRQIGAAFDVVAVDVDESSGPPLPPDQFAMRAAQKKARAAAEALEAAAAAAAATAAAETGATAATATTGATAITAATAAMAAAAAALDCAAEETSGGRGSRLIVVGADTVVVAPGGEILGKPASREDACRMLRMLEGRWHEVVTGIAIVAVQCGRRAVGAEALGMAEALGAAESYALGAAEANALGVAGANALGAAEAEALGAETTRVLMRALDEEAIRRYAATGDPDGKAGAYAIQGLGALLVERVDGCYNNVVGLPLHKLSTMLAAFGLPLLA